MNEKYDFGGWVTKNDVLCSDGTTIKKGCFAHNDGKRVPLSWNHNHNNPNDVLGYADLQVEPEGVYALGSFNDTEAAKTAKELIKHGDINALSIFANHLKRRGGDIFHGDIKEVSLVLAGADPTAFIDRLNFEHADDTEENDFDAFIYGDSVGLDLEHKDEVEEKKDEQVDSPEDSLEHACGGGSSSEKKKKEVEHAKDAEPTTKKEEEVKKTMDEEVKSDSKKTVGSVYDTMNDEQKNAVAYLVGRALSEGNPEKEKGGEPVKHNAFEDYDGASSEDAITHDDLNELCAASLKDVKNYGGSFKDSFIAHATNYGIGNIDMLFPDAQAINNEPEFIKREDAWVATVMNGTSHTPFSRIKSLFADITADEARAKGYITGHQKTEEFFSLAKRETTPQTVYKKQKLDRDNILDATTLDVVNWLMGEMRIMLNEELARAFLIGDGRLASSEDKISEDHIRPIATDNDVFTVNEVLTDAQIADPALEVETISKAHKNYKGSGSPVLFTTVDTHTNMLWAKDAQGRKLYTSDAELCAALRVSAIVEVPVMEDYSYAFVGKKDAKGAAITDATYNLIGIKVNLKDYNVGTDKGGQINNFNDFDIDYNQYKYLMETRCSGALVKWHCAQTFWVKKAA